MAPGRLLWQRQPAAALLLPVAAIKAVMVLHQYSVGLEGSHHTQACIPASDGHISSKAERERGNERKRG